MANTKKTSISQLDKITKELFEESRDIVWNGIEIKVKRVLDLKEALAFVDRITSSCFVDGTNEYLPEAEDFAYRCTLVEMFTNVKLPESIEHKYRVLYRTDLCKEIEKYVYQDQLEDMRRSAHDKAVRIADANISALQKEVSDAAAAVSDLVSKITGLFSGIEDGDIKKFVDSVGENGVLDERKLVGLLTGNGESAEEAEK